MAIGDPFVNDVAPVGSIGPGYATATNALLTEIKSRLEETVPFSALAGDELDMENSPIVRIQYAQFEPQVSLPATSPAGRIEYYGGDWYLVNDTGAIKVTEGAGLNFAAAGAIGGDYGGTNPALLQFVDSSKYYEFYDDFAGLAWAYTRMRGVDIAGGLTSIAYAQLRYAGTTSKVFTFPDHHAASGEKGLLQIDDAGTMEVNSTTRPMTKNIYLSGSAHLVHGTRFKQIALIADDVFVTSGSISAAYPLQFAGTNSAYRYPVKCFETGQQIISITLKGYRPATGNVTLKLFSTTNATGSPVTTQIGSTATDSGGAASIFTLTQSFTKTVAQYEHLFVEVAATGSPQVIVDSIEFGYNVVV